MIQTITLSDIWLAEGPDNFFNLSYGVLPSFGFFRCRTSDVATLMAAPGSLVFSSIVTLPDIYTLKAQATDASGTSSDIIVCDRRILWRNIYGSQDYNTYPAAASVNYGANKDIDYALHNLKDGVEWTYQEICEDIATKLSITFDYSHSLFTSLIRKPRNIIADGLSLDYVLWYLLRDAFHYLVWDPITDKYIIYPMGTEEVPQGSFSTDNAEYLHTNKDATFNTAIGVGKTASVVFGAYPDVRNGVRTYELGTADATRGSGNYKVLSSYAAVVTNAGEIINTEKLTGIATEIATDAARSQNHIWRDRSYAGIFAWVPCSRIHTITWRSNTQGAFTEIKSARPQEELPTERKPEDNYYWYSRFLVTRELFDSSSASSQSRSITSESSSASSSVVSSTSASSSIVSSISQTAESISSEISATEASVSSEISGTRASVSSEISKTEVSSSSQSESVKSESSATAASVSSEISKSILSKSSSSRSDSSSASKESKSSKSRHSSISESESSRTESSKSASSRSEISRSSSSKSALSRTLASQTLVSRSLSDSSDTSASFSIGSSSSSSMEAGNCCSLENRYIIVSGRTGLKYSTRSKSYVPMFPFINENPTREEMEDQVNEGTRNLILEEGWHLEHKDIVVSNWLYEPDGHTFEATPCTFQAYHERTIDSLRTGILMQALVYEATGGYYYFFVIAAIYPELSDHVRVLYKDASFCFNGYATCKDILLAIYSTVSNWSAGPCPMTLTTTVPMHGSVNLRWSGTPAAGALGQ